MVWKTPLFWRLFAARGQGVGAAGYSALVASAMRKNRGIQKNGKRNILARAGTANFKRRQTAAPPGGGRFSGRSAFGTRTISSTEPSGCNFWRLATAGKSFFAVPENHFNCAVGAYTHNIPLSPARQKGTEQTLKNQRKNQD